MAGSMRRNRLAKRFPGEKRFAPETRSDRRAECRHSQRSQQRTGPAGSPVPILATASPCRGPIPGLDQTEEIAVGGATRTTTRPRNWVIWPGRQWFAKWREDDDLSRVFVHVEAAAPERKQPGGFAIADDLAIDARAEFFQYGFCCPALGGRRHHGPRRFLEHLINGHRESVRRNGDLFQKRTELT